MIGRKMGNNHLFYERLNQSVNKSGKSVNQIERDLGYPRNTLHNYKMGAEPSASRLIELSQYFKLSPGYLMGVVPNNISNNIRSSKSLFRRMTEEQKIEMLELIQDWTYDKLSRGK